MSVPSEGERSPAPPPVIGGTVPSDPPRRMPTNRLLLVRNSIWNLLGAGGPMLVGIVVIPILVHTLGTDRFGILTLAWMVVGYFSLFDFGLGRALTQTVAERLGSQRPQEIPGLFWTALALMLVLGGVGAIIGVMLSAWAVHSILRIPAGLQHEALWAFYLLAVSLPFDISTAGLRGALEAYQRFGLTSIARFGMGLMTFLVPLAVVPFSHSLVAVVAGLLAGRVVAWAVYLVLCCRVLPALRKSVSLDRASARSLLHIGGWMTVSNIISPLMSTFDRFFLGAFVSVAAVAYYATPYDAVTKFLIIPAALAGVMFPAFAESFAGDQATAEHLYAQSLAATFVCICPFVLAVIILAPEGLRLWLGPEFATQSTRVLQVIAVGVLANGVAQVPFSLVQAVKHSDLTAKFHLAELPVYLAALWWLVRGYGIDGAAIAWSLRVGVDLLLLLFTSRRLLGITKPWSESTEWIVAATLLALSLALLPIGLGGKVAFLALTLVVYGIAIRRLVLARWGGTRIRLLPGAIAALRPWGR